MTGSGERGHGADDGDGGDGTAYAPSDGVDPDGEPAAGWPAQIAGVTETVVATLGPNERWNHAALGVEAPTNEDEDGGSTATATTWGATRTRRNLAERGQAYVQFTRDPVDFVAAALDVHETDAPILESADAWVRVEATERDRGEEASTTYVEWTLRPVEAAVRRRVVPTTNRGRAAVIEATVAASRLDVDAYDASALRDRLAWLRDVADRCGEERDRLAFDAIDDLADWRGGSENATGE